MFIRFTDSTDCSIEFESENVEEKKLVRAIYFALAGKTRTEKVEMIQKMIK